MDHYNNQQQNQRVSVDATENEYGLPKSTGPYVMPPPPMGYPVQDAQFEGVSSQQRPQTTSRGDGFWKGCCAAICCCCAIDICF